MGDIIEYYCFRPKQTVPLCDQREGTHVENLKHLKGFKGTRRIEQLEFFDDRAKRIIAYNLCLQQ